MTKRLLLFLLLEATFIVAFVLFWASGLAPWAYGVLIAIFGLTCLFGILSLFDKKEKK